jgi:hypothetical protein
MGKTLGDMSPEERKTTIERAASAMQAELQANAVAIGKIMDEAIRTPTAREILARMDAHGAPYVIPSWIDSKRVPIDYGMAIEIALSRHPSRVLANTNGYRYGRFNYYGYKNEVDVHMFGQHIATFRPEGVQLWSRGYVTQSTTEALGNLVDGRWFYMRDRKIYTRTYAGPSTEEEFTEGMRFPYRSEEK